MVKLADVMHKPVSQLPPGATGYQHRTEQQVLNDLANDMEIIDADDFLATIFVPPTYTLPNTLNTLEWWQVFNQGPIGSCLGCSDCQTATGVAWLQTGQRIEFSKMGHYLLTQHVGGMIGQDVGSVPTDALKVAARYGYCPMVWCDKCELLWQNKYASTSPFKPGQRLAPDYPRSYKDGLRTHREWITAAMRPGSNINKAMAMFKMDKYIRITKTSQIVKAKRTGVGFVQQSSLWTESFDQHPTRIENIGGGLHPRHGGHAYQVMDLTPDTEFVWGNTWGINWGDEGCKVVPDHVEQEVIDDKFSLVYLKTEMPYVKDKEFQPRAIPIKGSDWM